MHAERRAIVNDFLDISTNEENSEMLQDLKSNYIKEAEFERTIGNDGETSYLGKMPRIEKPSMHQFKTEK